MKLPKYQWLNCLLFAILLLRKRRIRSLCVIVNRKKFTYHFAGVTRKDHIVHFVGNVKPRWYNQWWFLGTFEGIPRHVVTKLKKKSWIITIWKA